MGERARQLKKQQSENQQEKAETPVKIKIEPKDTDDTTDFQAPGALSALPDDGDFESQIDSDQETVAFGGTPEKMDDEFNMKEKKSSKKDGIVSKERSEKMDSKDKNKRKRENNESKGEEKRRKTD